jgi:two-component system NtrC family response regulator
MPPLRERLADIIPLAEHFLRRAALQGAPDAVPKALSAEAAQRLLSHPWPGNVRELRNVMERCHALVRHRVIGGADLDLALGAAAPGEAPATLPADWLEGELPAAVEKLERLLIAHALAQTQGNRAETARRLGIHRQLLYRKLAQYGLE